MNRSNKAGGISSVAATAVSAVAAVLLATGLLTAAVAVVAAIQGYGLPDLYIRYFPTPRGMQPATPLPSGAYAIFVVYVVVAAEAAIVIRHWVGKIVRH